LKETFLGLVFREARENVCAGVRSAYTSLRAEMGSNNNNSLRRRRNWPSRNIAKRRLTCAKLSDGKLIPGTGKSDQNKRAILPGIS
jgi:hypothetical protein